MPLPAQRTPTLYETLVGAAWDQLAEAVRNLHGQGDVVHATGTFRVRHGRNPIARALAWLARLPAAAEAAAVHLVITPTPRGEEWKRQFDGRPLTSFQWQGRDGLLAEHVGPLELGLRLDVIEGALMYRSRWAALRLGPVRVPLPGWLAPRAVGWEKPGPLPNQVNVNIEIRLPLVGLVVAYTGTIANLEAKG